MPLQMLLPRGLEKLAFELLKLQYAPGEQFPLPASVIIMPKTGGEEYQTRMQSFLESVYRQAYTNPGENRLERRIFNREWADPTYFKLQLASLFSTLQDAYQGAEAIDPKFKERVHMLLSRLELGDLKLENRVQKFILKDPWGPAILSFNHTDEVTDIFQEKQLKVKELSKTFQKYNNKLEDLRGEERSCEKTSDVPTVEGLTERVEAAYQEFLAELSGKVSEVYQATHKYYASDSRPAAFGFTMKLEAVGQDVETRILSGWNAVSKGSGSAELFDPEVFEGDDVVHRESKDPLAGLTKKLRDEYTDTLARQSFTYSRRNGIAFPIKLDENGTIGFFFALYDGRIDAPASELTRNLFEDLIIPQADKLETVSYKARMTLEAIEKKHSHLTDLLEHEKVENRILTNEEYREAYKNLHRAISSEQSPMLVKLHYESPIVVEPKQVYNVAEHLVRGKEESGPTKLVALLLAKSLQDISADDIHFTIKEGKAQPEGIYQLLEQNLRKYFGDFLINRPCQTLWGEFSKLKTDMTSKAYKVTQEHTELIPIVVSKMLPTFDMDTTMIGGERREVASIEEVLMTKTERQLLRAYLTIDEQRRQKSDSVDGVQTAVQDRMDAFGY